MTAEEFLKSERLLQQKSKKITANEFLQSQGMLPIPKAQPKKTLGSDLVKAYENFGTGIIQGVLGVGRYLTSAAQQTGKAINTGYNIFNQASNLLGKKQVNKPLELYNKAQSKIADVSGKATTKIGQAMDKKQEQVQYQTSQISNPLVKKASEYSTAIGQQIPTIAASIINPALGLGVATTSAGGNYLQEAKQKGASDLQALTVGTAKGLAEGATEMIGIGKVIKGTKALAKGSTKVAIKDFGINIVNNALQEASMEPLSEAIDQSVLGKSDWNGIAKRMIKAGVDGAIIGTIMSGAGVGLGKAVNITNKIAQGKTVTPQEIQQVSNEIQPKIETTKPIEPQVPTTQNKAFLPQQDISTTPKTNNVEIQPINDKSVIVKQPRQSSFINTAQHSQVVDNRLPDIKNVSYEIATDKQSVDYANQILNDEGFDSSLNKVNSVFNSGKIASKDDIVLGQRLIQEALNRGDQKTAIDLIENLSIMGTEAGQSIQALSLINKLTPEGQLGYITKVTERLNKQQKEKYKGKTSKIVLSDKTKQDIVSQTTPNGLSKAMDKAKQELSSQLKATVGDKISAFRYLSMLGNPTTHIRNIVGNTAMSTVNKAKNVIARGIETILQPKTRTRTFVKPTQEVKNFAIQDTIDNKKLITGEDKFGIQNSLEKNKKIFDTKWLEKAREIGMKSLEFEDWFFKSKEYPKYLAEYLTANGIKTQQDIKNNPSIVEKGRLKAVEEALKVTFQEYSALATALNKVENINLASKLIVGGALPFKKTPINITKAATNYSPAGLLWTLAKRSFDLKNGKIDANQYIDRIAEGITGSGIVTLGAFLAAQGIITGASSDDPKERELEKAEGFQPYALKIGDKYYSLSWLSPTAIPLLTGVQIYNTSQGDNKVDFAGIVDVLGKTLDPLTDMSMLSGVNSIITSYNSAQTPGGAIGATLGNIAQSYAGQFIPSVSGKLARVVDPTVRDITGSKESILGKGIDTFGRGLVNKIPFASKMLEPQVNILGNEVKQEGNVGTRILNNFFNPAKVTTEVKDSVLQELRALKDNGVDVLPTKPSSILTINKTKYNLTPKEFTELKKTKGTEATNIVNELLNSPNYQQLTSEEKAKTIQAIYEYTSELAKEEYSNNKALGLELSQTYKDLQKYKSDGLPISTGIMYKQTIDKITGDKETNEKGKIVTIEGSTLAKKTSEIAKMDLTDEQKTKLLDLSQTSEDPVSYEEIKDLNENSYQTYYSLSKTQRPDYKNLKEIGIDENTLNEYYNNVGKVEYEKNKTGAKKQAVFNYINSLNTSPQNKLLLFLNSGYKAISSDKLYNYINSLQVSQQKKAQLWEQFK